jgi:hypothetical protein
MERETIQKARQSNLPLYLLNKGESLIQTGNRYRHAEHKSLIFTENAYYWNSKGEKGNAVDFLMSFYNMNFSTAVKELAGQQKKEITAQPHAIQPFFFDNLDIYHDMRRAVAYLTQTRSIDISILENLIKSKYIFQENKTNNIIFPMYDENNNIVGAETSGTLSDRRFKGIKAGSKYGYGYNIGYMNSQGIYLYALFFESAIDLISFIEIERMNNKTLSGCLLVSLAGVKENIIEHTLKIFSNNSTLQCVLCVDNDMAGENLRKNISTKKINFKNHFPNERYKDWNEQLKSVKAGINYV